MIGGLFGLNKAEASRGEKKGNGPKAVIDIPASTVKMGPLNFFLQIYLVGEQNNPVKGSWVFNNNDENGSLDMYYQDGTGMFSVSLAEDRVVINRYGQKPSLQYMLQESVMLHGILDELTEIAFGVEDIEPGKRLLQLVSSEDISKARETLPARKEENSR